MEKEKVTAINMKCPQISVIVPVYKVEPYLRCCVDSILAQTFTDFELILVDDGSPDHCGAICDEYAAQDSRITVIHQENQGVSAARNAALDWVFANSNSAWITFVDSDDAVVPEYLEILYRYGQETDADIVITKGLNFAEDSELRKSSGNNPSFQMISGKEACIRFYQEDWAVTPFPWGKFCRRKLLKNLRFPEGIAFAEDEALVVKLLYGANTICVLSSSLYCYRKRETGASEKTFSFWIFDYANVIDSSISYFEEHKEREIAQLAKKKWKLVCAKNVLIANASGMVDSIPPKCKMPILQAFCITVTDTMRNGGMKRILVRIRQFVRRTKH